VQILLLPGKYFCLPLIEEQVDPTVWTNGDTMGQAQTAVPVIIHFMDPFWFLHQKQYPLRPGVKEGLIHIIKHLKRQGLPIEYSSPHNTSILGVKEGPKKMEVSPKSLPD
jgi:hypothetical protein